MVLGGGHGFFLFLPATLNKQAKVECKEAKHEIVDDLSYIMYYL